jgi:cupin fold WbuC family metalloprotein
MDNRVPAHEGADELSFRPVDRLVMDLASDRARRDPRRRALLRYHEFPDHVQRMINAVEPESYARPHTHANPPKVEIFVVLRGSGVVVRYDEAGNILEATRVEAGGPVHGVEVPAGAWHSLLALERDTVFFEVKDGPYDAATDKQFAPWSPPEDDPIAARRFLDDLRARLGLPPLTQLDENLLDEALDEDEDLP